VVAALQRHLRAAPRQLCRGDVFCVALRPCTSEDGVLRSLHGIGASGKLGPVPTLRSCHSLRQFWPVRDVFGG